MKNLDLVKWILVVGGLGEHVGHWGQCGLLGLELVELWVLVFLLWISRFGAYGRSMDRKEKTPGLEGVGTPDSSSSF